MSDQDRTEPRTAPDGTDQDGTGQDGTGPSVLDRRGFLKAAGFTLTGAVANGCTPAPIDQAIPFLIQPEEIVPGRSLWYASTCGGCTAGCGALVKCRDGRPTKIEGNREHPLSTGGLCAVGQAALLGLYDSQRLTTPLLAGQAADWATVDETLRQRLDAIAARGGRVRLLTETLNGPTERVWIERFLGHFSDARHVVYDPLSCSAISQACRRTHGVALTPRYRFDRAEVIVSFDADFLGTWLSPVEHAAGFRAGRSLEGDPPRLSFHAQLESRLSLTGSNADRRLVVRPEAIPGLLGELTRALARHAGVSLGNGPTPAQAGASAIEPAALDDLATRLWQARGRSLVVCGSQDVDTQVLVNLANHLLANDGATFDLARPSRQRRGDDQQLAELVRELEAGIVDALLVRGVNPVYDLPNGSALATALESEKVPLVVSFASHHDETAAVAGVVCPDCHALESWRDAEPVAGLLSLTQPAMRPLGQTRSWVESLAAWVGAPATARQLMRDTWEQTVYPRRLAGAAETFQNFWDQAVHDGFVEVEVEAEVEVAVDGAPLSFDIAVASRALAAAGQAPAEPPTDAFTLVLYPKVAILDGRHAENPWLQELPDPITKVVWDNYASLSPRAARALGVEQGDVVRVDVGNSDQPVFDGAPIELPVVVQPGQHDRVVAVALGYGRGGTRRFSELGPRWLQGRRTVAPGETVGRNVAPLAIVAADGQRHNHRSGVRVEPTGARYELASTQTYHALAVPDALAPVSGEPRPIVQETTLPAYAKDRGAGAPHGHLPGGDLWPEHPYDGYHWGMAIDLNACTGCSACIVACQVENNVPVVGKDEVRRRRDMHWLRLDRYYHGDLEGDSDAEHEGEHGGGVDVFHQPMTCHHCDNAPCETVCPVLATVHSAEGLNQQIYNRCVGTRYCANNCPYKVRRFNWFDYPHRDPLENLTLNPDVVVRSRGVMEKCSFCVQRIQEAKQQARRQGRAVADGEIQTACQQSCPTQAITFGDLGDPASRLARQVDDPRHYRLFEELNIRPSLGYLRRVRHRQDDEEIDHG